KHDSNIEKILDEQILPANSLFYLCGYKNMIDHVISMISPLGFVDNRRKRKDGSFDIKYELYGI
ncbi:MAG TPA: ferredoxin--NADP reductase, partial [Nitrosopumilaceae archaeon]|nr:ferredoxin--NADP reductase [Nitrosopumilaceae archaeon]